MHLFKLDTQGFEVMLLEMLQALYCECYVIGKIGQSHYTKRTWQKIHLSKLKRFLKPNHFYQICYMQHITSPQKPQIRYRHLVSNLKYILWIEKPWSVALRSVALQFVRQLSHAYMEPHELSFLAKMELFL